MQSANRNDNNDNNNHGSSNGGMTKYERKMSGNFCMPHGTVALTVCGQHKKASGSGSGKWKAKGDSKLQLSKMQVQTVRNALSE